MLSDPAGNDVVVRLAAHLAGVPAVPAVGVHVTALPRNVVPLKNCTVLVIPGPLFTPEVTTAASVTLAPRLIAAGVGVTTVVVAWVPPVTVTVAAADGPMLL